MRHKTLITAIISGCMAPTSFAQDGSVYHALPGKCRVASSFGAGGPGPLLASVDRNIDITSIGSYLLQGGSGNAALGNSSASCGIPSSITALVISTSVVSRGQAGTLKVFEAGKASADGNSVAFSAAGATTNDMIVPARELASAAEIAISSSREVDYVLDVVGYFIPRQLSCYSTSYVGAVLAPGAFARITPEACASGYQTVARYCVPGVATAFVTTFTSESDNGCFAVNRQTSGNVNMAAQNRCCR